MTRRSDVTVVAFIIALMMLIVGLDQGIGDEQPNNEPYTGLCVEPKSQGGC